MKDARARLFDLDTWQGEMPKFVATSHSFMVKKSSPKETKTRPWHPWQQVICPGKFHHDRTLFSWSLEIIVFIQESSQNGHKFQVSEIWSGWWFGTFRDNPSHWLSYFSRWFKPPTSYNLPRTLLNPPPSPTVTRLPGSWRRRKPLRWASGGPWPWAIRSRWLPLVTLW